eukprot:CAMPEP_0115703684 /NCGR_PEP_ID=MMETSP0272-20121206/69238_1 /TAXON_ID=71861 /ORGANISM="Scrippsiella trochoidea, Strain CCMP3099" /LENGTH=47 /DNA_ID= /DNA_START= /DNA_END= /DNA_ORIENTATION=
MNTPTLRKMDLRSYAAGTYPSEASVKLVTPAHAKRPSALSLQGRIAK